MTHFEQNGINYQHDAATKEQALRSFMYSCKCCCTKGKRIDCDRCAIAEVHSNVMAYFADREMETK